MQNYLNNDYYNNQNNDMARLKAYLAPVFIKIPYKASSA